MKIQTSLALLFALGCRAAVPGNGTVEGSEQCDDGNAVNGDGCSLSCELEVCGDGLVNNSGLEQCDDGNRDNDDGCSSVCRKERCGDGLVNNLKEQCDDDNVDSGDGCNARCQVETCGDGLVNNKTETCDDGNRADGDGCQRDCQAPPKSWSLLPPKALKLEGAFIDVSLYLQDLDKDGRLDLVVLDPNGAPRIFSGLGDGGFSATPLRSAFSTQKGANKMLFADLNGDSAMDFVSVQPGFSGPSLFFGYSAPDVTRSQSIELDSLRAGAAIAAADFNRDGKADVASAMDGLLMLWPGGVDGPESPQDLSAASFRALAAADFNGDTFPDLAALQGDQLTFFLGSKSGALTAQKPITVSKDAGSLSAGDADKDGLSSLIVSGARLDIVAYQKSTKDFALTLGPSVTTKSGSVLPMSTCDFNNDGQLDAAILENDLLRVFLGDSSGGFGKPLEFPAETKSPNSAMTTGDLNNDGACDLITAGSMPTVWLGGSVATP